MDLKGCSVRMTANCSCFTEGRRRARACVQTFQFPISIQKGKVTRETLISCFARPEKPQVEKKKIAIGQGKPSSHQ